MKVIQAKDWAAVMEAVAQIMTEQADHLCEMDARMGDGDLGLTMKKGYCALPEIYAGLEEADMGKRLSKSGMKMSSVVPSTMGTLMSSGWMEGGKRLIGKEEVDASAFAAFLRGFADGIAKRGKCVPGERTVLDAIFPAADAAEQAASRAFFPSWEAPPNTARPPSLRPRPWELRTRAPLPGCCSFRACITVSRNKERSQ